MPDTRRYRPTSIKDAIALYTTDSNKKYLKDGKLFPCPNCTSGTIVDPTEIYDVVEGYKLARRIPCLVCHGALVVEKYRFYSIVKPRIAEAIEKQKDYNRKKKRLRQLLHTLSGEDLDLLRAYSRCPSDWL